MEARHKTANSLATPDIERTNDGMICHCSSSLMLISSGNNSIVHMLLQLYGACMDFLNTL